MTSLVHRVAALGCALAVANCAQNPVTGGADFVMMSEAEEVRVGKAEHPKVERQYGFYKGPDLQRYVAEIGARLAKASHRPDLPWTFTVVDSPEVNAFALPGGYIYITRGIMAYLNSEAELAAVLGHEIGHVTARHGVRQVSAAQGAGIAATIASIVVPGMRSDAAQSLVGLLGNSLLAGYGREHELEADRLGAEYLARTGYDPQAMIRVVGVLKNQELFDAELARKENREPRRYHGVFASHPDNDTRLQEVVSEAAKVKASGRAEKREEFLKRMDRTVYGDSPSQGFVRDGTFYHPELALALRFPPQWKVQNRPDRVGALHPGKEAMVELRHAGKAQGSPADVLRQALKLGFGSRIDVGEVNGLPSATTAVALQGRPTRAQAVFLKDSAYLVAAQAQHPQAMTRHEADIRATFQSFRAMTADERSAIRPLLVRVITAAPGTTYAQLARGSALGPHAESQLRLLNAQYPAGEPAAGQALKIVE